MDGGGQQRPGTQNGGKAQTGSAEYPPESSQLIESIYKIALEPHSYDDFMDQWDEHISASVQRLEALRLDALPHAKSHQEAVDPNGLARHFEIGFRLLEEMGRRPAANFFAPLEGDQGRPALLLDASGRVVWFNGAAADLLNLKPKTVLRDLVEGDRGLDVFDGLLKRAQEKTDGTSGPDDGAGKAGPRLIKGSRTEMLRLSKTDGKTLHVGARLIEDRSGEWVVLLRQEGPDWHDAVSAMFRDDFGLTAAEIETTRFLCDGLTIPAIAGHRGTSEATVRTQLKRALAKTGARTQADLLRLALSLIRLAEHEHGPPEPKPTEGDGETVPMEVNGRATPVILHGATDGFPVVFLHGMLDGCGITARLARACRERGLRLIAPVRPHFGEAPAVDGNVREAPRRMARDVQAVLDQLGLDRAILLGHMAGSLYAFAAAELLQDRAVGIVCVAGGVPIKSASQFAVMSRRQRLVAYTARYTPGLLPFILRAGIRQLDFGGQDNFIAALYETSPKDLLAAEDREVHDIVCKGYHFTIAQGHRAFEIDSWHVVRDWSHFVEGSAVPVHLVHGVHDPVVSIASVRAFKAHLGERCRISEREDCGQLVFYHRPDAVLDAVESFLP